MHLSEELDKKFLELLESTEIEDTNDEETPEDEIEEMSVSTGAGAYDSKYAFGAVDDDTVEAFGYEKVKESVYKRAMKSMFVINEAKYSDYKRDESMTASKKVNLAIKEVNRKLFEIERIVNQNVRLKVETGVDESAYWKHTRNSLKKISERMFRISEKIVRF